ncbi:hypothetical protein K4A83_22545 [Spirulina subsalsa FACHB-351]|uniref:Polysaccharide chain length determinant N-terminal domain-containing protein n=1 Tax=Spirulina subsalsa FACHB-351 TaxID=234711 RepID=A0ABT3LBW4_9CYAN|nr:hypothetical protein [Spirulina subsalsa]MCW6039007.1 hypothetical protein [Spirulina subsalsa FACHB-351]
MEKEQTPAPPQPQPVLIEDTDEISLVDIIRFLTRQWKFIGLTTVTISLLALAYSFLQPKPPYQRTVTLSLQFNPFFLTDRSSVPKLDINRANTLTTELLQTQTPESFSLQSNYDPITQKITLTLKSDDNSTLETAPSVVLEQLNEDLQDALKPDIQTSLGEVTLYIERIDKVITQLENQLTQTNPTDSPRQEALQSERASQLAELTAFQFDQTYLQQSLDNPANFTQQVLPITILSESPITQPSRSRLQLIILSLIAGFMVAVLAAIILEQIPRLQAELTQGEPDKTGKA